MSDSAIAIRYAKALLNIAVEEQRVEPYADELACVAELIRDEDLLRLLLDSPTFPLEKKTAIMRDIAEKLQLSVGMTKFLELLLQKGRIINLPQINSSYRKYADELSGIVRANITAAHALSEDKLTAIKAGLEGQTGKQVVLNCLTDESLIGGLQAEMGGRLFDGSVKTQLKRITETLAKG